MTNPNMVVFGQIGRGKSSFVKSYLWRQAVFGRQAWVVDPKGEYGPLARAWGVRPVALYPGGSVRLNPLDTRPAVGPGLGGQRDGRGRGVRAAIGLTQRRWPSTCLGRDLLPPRAGGGRRRLRAPPPTGDRRTAGLLGADAAPGGRAPCWTRRPRRRATSAPSGRPDGGRPRRGPRAAAPGPRGPARHVRRPDHSRAPARRPAGRPRPGRGVQLARPRASSWPVPPPGSRGRSWPSAAIRWCVVVDEAWAILSNLGVARWLQASWKLSRAFGVANMAVLHRLSDLHAVGASDSEQVSLAEGLLADSETRVVYAQSPGEVERTGDAPRPDRDRGGAGHPAAPGRGPLEGGPAVLPGRAPAVRRGTGDHRHRPRHGGRRCTWAGTFPTVPMSPDAKRSPGLPSSEDGMIPHTTVVTGVGRGRADGLRVMGHELPLPRRPAKPVPLRRLPRHGTRRTEGIGPAPHCSARPPATAARAARGRPVGAAG